MVYELVAGDRENLFSKCRSESGVSLLRLAQVNKQLRAEYRPIALRQRQIRISRRNFNGFLEDFFPLDNVPEATIAKYVGSIALDIHMMRVVTFDLMPIIRLLQLAPGLRFRVVGDFDGYQDFDQHFIEDLNTVVQCWPGVEPRGGEFTSSESMHLNGLDLPPPIFAGLKLRKVVVHLSFGFKFKWNDAFDDSDTESQHESSENASGSMPEPTITFVFAKADNAEWMDGAKLHLSGVADTARHSNVSAQVQTIWEPSLIWKMSDGSLEHAPVPEVDLEADWEWDGPEYSWGVSATVED